MNPPFSVEQFFAVFERYNHAVGPVPLVLYGLAAWTIARAARPRPGSDRRTAAVLGVLWAWMAVVYHWVYFSAINPAAVLFGGLFLAQAGLFLWAGVVSPRLSFRLRRDVYGVTGAALAVYALAVYPLLGALGGHGYPRGPVLGLPCPTTILTFGLLLWVEPPVPTWLLPIPAAWSLLGTSAAVRLGVTEDLGLVVAGALGTALVLRRNRRAHAQARTPGLHAPA